MSAMESAPSNGTYIILGEINLLLTSLKRTNTKYSSNSHYDPMSEPLTRSLNELKSLLNEHSDLTEIDPNTFLTPFLEVIKSEETSGPVTGMALTAVNKFISYNLIGLGGETTSNCVQHIADSITHARFVGTDSANDEVVLMKILHVLRTLMLSPIGLYLTNSSVCEIMQSCFQICFENRLSELLRRTAEIILVDMVQLLFARLPQFKDEIRYSSIKKLTMRADQKKQVKKVKKVAKAVNVGVNPEEQKEQTSEKKEPQKNVDIDGVKEDTVTSVSSEVAKPAAEETTVNKPMEQEKFVNIENIQVNVSNEESKLCGEETSAVATAASEETGESGGGTVSERVKTPSESSPNETTDEQQQAMTGTEQQEFVNPRGVRFVQDASGTTTANTSSGGAHVANLPYGLPCVRELLRFLISLIGSKNSELMIAMGLNLITVGLEAGIDHISAYQSLLAYVKDELCRNLYNLLGAERLAIYTNVLRVSFLLFESLRGHLKMQFEHFMSKLMDVLVSESTRVSAEHKEITLDFIVQMLRIPGFAVELYLNYDCSLNSTNLFEDLTKLLSKNAFSVQSLLTPNSLSLCALLTIVENIDLESSLRHAISSEDRLTLLQNSLGGIRAPTASGFGAACVANVASKLVEEPTATHRRPSIGSETSPAYKPRDSGRRIRVNRMKVESEQLPTADELRLVRTKKRLIQQSVDLFNQSPSKSIQFLKDNSIFSNEPSLFMKQLIKYLKETPMLDKKVIGEFLSNRKNTSILDEYIRSFDFNLLRIDEALRIFLEAFRLPGEAPLISNVLEHFAHHYRSANPIDLYANDDAAFTLAYAVIMLNVDQHNHNVKKQSTPMVCEEFKKNLTKVNGGGNFDERLLEDIYQAVKSEEIVMPSEHTGALRDNYLWKLVIRRSATADARYVHAPTGSYNQEIFNIVWGQTISALSFVYDKSFELAVIQKTIAGFRRCAQIAAYYTMSDVFDNIVISLCKFTHLTSPTETADQIAVNFGLNNKAQIACKTVFQLVHDHGDILRDGWKNILDCIIQMFKAKLLPKVLVECEDYLNSKGRIVLIKEDVVPIVQKSEGSSGLFSSFFPFMSSDLSANKGPTPEEQEAMKNAQACIDECHVEQLVHDTKFLRADSLLELVKALIFASSQAIEPAELSLQDVRHASQGTVGSVASGSVSNQLGNSTSLTNLSLSMMSEPRVDIDAAVFSLECLIKVVLQNRDRFGSIWSLVRNHFYNIIVNANDYSFFLQRAVIGLLRISARMLRREDMASEVLGSLRMLLMFKKKSIVKRLSRHVSFGVHDLLRTNAVNIHSNDDWSSIFTILQVYGAGATSPYATAAAAVQLGDESALATELGIMTRSFSIPKGATARFAEPKTLSTENLKNAKAAGNSEGEATGGGNSDRGYTSDSEVYEQQQSPTGSSNIIAASSTSALNVTSKDVVIPFDLSFRRTSQMSLAANQYKIDLDDEGLGEHDKKAFAKCCEILTFLIRDMAHVTLQNFESCIHCLRTFVEACVLGDRSEETKKEAMKNQALAKTKEASSGRHRLVGRHKAAHHDNSASNSNAHGQLSANAAAKRNNTPAKYDDSDEDDQFITSYETISIQLLDLLDTLHIKAASIFTQWSEEQRRISQQTELVDSVVSNLWSKCWCPILQGIARLSCDTNGEVRMHALQYLQRALLVHELQTLSAMEWEACFNKVLFPLLAKLLENIDPRNSMRMEETRMRASTLLCKVFLQHLTTLARLSTFTALWLTILDYMDKYMKSDKSDLLHDVIPESLKNMLLVMETTGLFNEPPSIAGDTPNHFSSLCSITKDRIESFLPGLWEDLFRVNTKNPPITSAVSETNLTSSETPAAVSAEDTQELNMRKETSSEELVRKESSQSVHVENERSGAATPSGSASAQTKFTRSATEIKDV